MERILINKANDILRVALVDGQSLYDIEIEHTGHDQQVDSICNGEVISIEPSLEAAFVNFGSKRNGFLPLKEIAAEYYPTEKRDQRTRISIKDILFPGQKILVQVNKEERGTKGAALSSYISLAGCYLVLMPNNPKAGGISRRIEGEERDELRNILNALNIPDTMGVIIRTAGMGKSLEELQWDLNVLLNLWESIKAASKTHGAPHLIHQESDIAIRAVRDQLRQNINEILIDDQTIFDKVKGYIERIRPDFVDRVKFYADDEPLFSRFQIEKQIESAFQRKIRLPSGGEIVIDRSEALTAIDVNSAQATKGGHIEETALFTNLEAAEEIARQLRIRDLGGLFVIDFIDMDSEENRQKVIDRVKEATKTDRARIQIAHISRFGLLEMSRQRLRPALSESSLIVCPRCHGQGSIRNAASQGLSILHLIEENASKKNLAQIRVQAPVEIATYLLNECRMSIVDIERIRKITIIIIANPYLESPQYNIECITTETNKTEGSSANRLSYEQVKAPVVEYEYTTQKEQKVKPQPAILDLLPDTPAPQAHRRHPKKPGVIKRFIHAIFGDKKPEVTPEKPEKKHHHKSQSRPQQHRKPSYRKTTNPHQQHRSRANYRRTRRNFPHREEPNISPNISHGAPKKNPSQTFARDNETSVVKKAPIAEKTAHTPIAPQKAPVQPEPKKTTATIEHQYTPATQPKSSGENLVQIETSVKKETSQNTD